jgi:hypothetical protein
MKSYFTCRRPYLISTSKSLYFVRCAGEGDGIFSVEPKILARLANTGSVANARLSLYTYNKKEYQRKKTICIMLNISTGHAVA